MAEEAVVKKLRTKNCPDCGSPLIHIVKRGFWRHKVRREGVDGNAPCRWGRRWPKRK